MIRKAIQVVLKIVICLISLILSMMNFYEANSIDKHIHSPYFPNLEFDPQFLGLFKVAMYSCSISGAIFIGATFAVYILPKLSIAFFVLLFSWSLFMTKWISIPDRYTESEIYAHFLINTLVSAIFALGTLVIVLLTRKRVKSTQKEVIDIDTGNMKSVTQLQESAATQEDTKECPQCAEIIKAKARICRYCKFSFELDQQGMLDPEGESV